MNERITRVMTAVAEHPATPWGQWIVGLLLLGTSLLLIVREKVVDKFTTGFHASIGVVALLVLPGVFAKIATNAKVGIDLYRQWKSSNGGNGGSGPPAPPSAGAPA